MISFPNKEDGVSVELKCKEIEYLKTNALLQNNS